jgi:hypothetical protein
MDRPPVSLAELRDTALGYAARGWHVFPLHTWRDGRCSCGNGGCPRPAKHPRTRHGLKEASIDSATIHAWWTRWPDANIAIATGAVSGIVVIDIDPRHGGPTSLEAWERDNGPLPRTLETETGGGGSHKVFLHPGFPVKNRTNLVPGVDVRGDGGYIVVPPSVHCSGGRYRWKR